MAGEEYEKNNISKFKAMFLNLSTMSFGLDNSLLWGLSCALQDVSQHPYPSLYPLDAINAASPSCDNQNYIQPLPSVTWGAKSPH